MNSDLQIEQEGILFAVYFQNIILSITIFEKKVLYKTNFHIII